MPAASPRTRILSTKQSCCHPFRVLARDCRRRISSLQRRGRGLSHFHARVCRCFPKRRGRRFSSPPLSCHARHLSRGSGASHGCL